VYHGLVTLCLYHEDRGEVKGGGDAEGEGGGLCTKTDKLEIYISRFGQDKQADHTTMASRTLSLPLRAFAGTRPSIQAWRTTRSFATELAPASTTLPSSTTPIITPVVDDAQFQTTGLHETDDSTSGKLRPVGVVVSAGKMERTVKVRLPSQKWNNYLRKVNCALELILGVRSSYASGNSALTGSLFPGL
jgi:hypothetical protein